MPRTTREALAPSFVPQHPALALSQYADDAVVENGKLKQQRHEEIANAANRAAGYGKLCEQMLLRQQRAVQSSGLRMIGPVTLKTRGGLVCGMSTPTLYEAGMTMSRPHGVPYIPDSSIKGVMASWLAEILTGQLNPSESAAERAMSEAGLLDLFRQPKGEDDPPENPVTFFDALPIKWKLAPDVTTPHHAGWYQGDKAPDGVENPVPVYFLTVAAGSEFVFRFGLRRERSAPIVPESAQLRLDKFRIPRAGSFQEWWLSLLASTADFKGFGAQSGGGYGHLTPP